MLKKLLSSTSSLARIAIVAVGVTTLLGGCADEKFLHFQTYRPQEAVSFIQNVKEIKGGDAVDILWVIDNSGSMDDHQRKVIANTQLFMQNFSKSSLHWKMGLISTTEEEDPYVGFDASTPLNWSVLDPVSIFQTAVASLGTSGSGTEMTLRPINKALSNYSNFTRPGTPFALMLVTDAEEQSEIDFDADFLPPFKKAIGENTKLFVYEVLNASDLGCSGESGEGWDYAGSSYEKLTKIATIGKVFPLCGANFGPLLASISNEIVSNVTHSTIYLKSRPKLDTIRVSYKGTELKGGEKDNGGVWTYDFDLNAIVFSDLSFAVNETDSVTVDYEVDDGFPSKKVTP